MKRFTLAFLATISLAIAQETKPNIILIFADDLGYKDCGFTGSVISNTPIIDNLAKQGMVFENAYAAAGNCAPSRASLMSGKYSPSHGVFAVGSTSRGPKDEMKLIPVKNTEYLKPSYVTIAEALKFQGYKTALFGKWHLGKADETGPLEQGFDVYLDQRVSNPNKIWGIPDDPKGMFSLTNEVINFLDLNKTNENPFFVFLSHHAIHSRLEAKPKTLDKYLKQNYDKQKALYAACIEDFDESIGLLLSYLKATGLDKNTLVIFTSDNGATNESSQEPLRGNKGGYYEGGIRVPFIAYWPGKINPGTIIKTPVINIDLYPTFLALAKGNALDLDGEDLGPILTNSEKSTKRKSIFWHFPGYLNDPVIRGRDSIFRTRPVSVIRKGDWKLHLYHEEWLISSSEEKGIQENAIELYNLADDIGERNNLVAENPQKRKELLNDLVQWITETKAPLPTLPVP